MTLGESKSELIKKTENAGLIRLKNKTPKKKKQENLAHCLINKAGNRINSNKKAPRPDCCWLSSNITVHSESSQTFLGFFLLHILCCVLKCFHINLHSIFHTDKAKKKPTDL